MPKPEKGSKACGLTRKQPVGAEEDIQVDHRVEGSRLQTGLLGEGRNWMKDGSGRRSRPDGVSCLKSQTRSAAGAVVKAASSGGQSTFQQNLSARDLQAGTTRPTSNSGDLPTPQHRLSLSSSV